MNTRRPTAIEIALPRFALAYRASEVEAAAAAATDRELARRLSEGDPHAVAWIYDRYAAGLYRMLVVLLGSPHDAEDAVQEVFAKLLGGRIGRVRDLRAYVFAAARNEANTILRRRRYTTDEPPPDLAAPEVARDRNLLALMRYLPPEQREVVSLKVYEEMTFAEIATIVGASLNTVTSRYRYAILKLRSLAKEVPDA